jgi:hypothetical protein
MNYSTNDILLASPHREIVLWRRMGGSNPGYGLDIDGVTVAFVGQGLTLLRQRARDAATRRALPLAKPTLEPIVITNPAGAEATHTDTELDKMLGRFYTGDTDYAWGEAMTPTQGRNGS